MLQNKLFVFLEFILIFLFTNFNCFSVPDNFPIKIGSYGKWSAYYYLDNGKKICYVKSYAVDSLTNHSTVNQGRKPFIAFSIFDQHKVEFYSNFDYGLRINSNPVASTGNKIYLLFSDGDYSEIGYLLDDLSEKNFLIDAINGNYIYIFSRSIYNTYSIDMYSIHDLNKAFQVIKKTCNFKENITCEKKY